MTKSPFQKIEEYKVQASILLKQFRAQQSEQAARRFQRLPQFSDLSVEVIFALNDRIKHKHALQIIAIENQFETWAELKTHVEREAERLAQTKQKPFAYLYPKRCQGFLNQWFAQYDEAKQYREENGGYLLPYDTQFFVCESDYIEALGLEPMDKDWATIGWDWAKPVDHDAWQRLYKKLMRYEAKKGEQ